MLHYYLNLPKDNASSDFDNNLKRSFAVMKTAKESFEPFERYLNNVTKALEQKEVEAAWKKVNTKNSARLSIIGGLYAIPKGFYRIQLKTETEEPDFSEEIVYVINGIKEKALISKEDYEAKRISLPDAKGQKIEKARWGFVDIELILEEAAIPENTIIIEEDDSRIICYSENKLDKYQEIKKIEPFIPDGALCFENGAELKAEREEGLTILLDTSNDYGKIIVTENKITFRIDQVQKKDKEAWRIQLVEPQDTNKDEDIQTLSPLRYFFDDGVEITDDKRNKYQLVDGRESENTLVLKKQNDKGYWDFCFPDEKILKVRVNTYSLKKQLEAVSTLRTMPAQEQGRLIQLFENREKVRWLAPDRQSLDVWYVITDLERNGSAEQRDFVKKALNTPDFAILEGPPGSGKTTVILELICQLAKRNQRVLLCGSTHVAIDNILERLKEKRDNSTLLEKLHILPVRIGDENRINEDVREFQIENLQESAGISEDLLLEAANLVCGTTIGILQHPQFKKRIKSSRIEPIIPDFDYLIIDESSKTTFQEFLVPALYAKKWILAGDVMQLSPFTERENIVSNLEHLTIEGQPLSLDLQNAVFYLDKLKDITRYGNNRFVLPVAEGVLKEIYHELKSGRNLNRREDQKLIVLLFANAINGMEDFENIMIRSFAGINVLELAAADIIIADENHLSELLPVLPERHALLKNRTWEETEHAFIHNAYQMRQRFSYKERGREFNNSFDMVEHINDYFKEKNWAEEVAWRIDREHQLRLVEKNSAKEGYTKKIEELLPQSIDKEKMENAVNSVAVMAFPSILESLVQGIKGSRKLKVETTISEGFKEEELGARKTTLVYQHRMHPEISGFPRERFYKKSGALLDLEKPQPIGVLRSWDYQDYPSRSVWINVDGETKRNYNEKEVAVLMSHLEQFTEWAKNKPPPEGKAWTVACLTFYRGQETRIREKLQKLCKKENGVSNFKHNEVIIKLHTVDKFQGHEADVVFLSMVQTTRDGFIDNPNRLNVALTRAKFQMLIFGKHDYFLNVSRSEDLKALASNHKEKKI